MSEDPRQEALDRFYWEHGPCCAGCDWWRGISSTVGTCAKAAPMSGLERLGLLGLEFSSLNPGAGHPFTMRDHHCGEFRDEFDWLTLPLAYRSRVGCPLPAPMKGK